MFFFSEVFLVRRFPDEISPFFKTMMRNATSVGLRSAASLVVVSASSKRATNRSILFCSRYNKGNSASSKKMMSSYSYSLFTKNTTSGFSPSASSSPRRRFARASDFACHHQTSSSFSSASFSSFSSSSRGSLSVRKSNTPNEASKDAQIWIDSWKTAGGGGGSSSGGRIWRRWRRWWRQ